MTAGEEKEPERETGEEEKKRNYWWLSLGLILLLLAGGGYYALTGMRQAAHKLAGGRDYDQLSANSSMYDGGEAAAKNANYFPLDEEAARAQAVGGAKPYGMSSLSRARAEPAADASGAPASPNAAVQGAQESSSAGTAGGGMPGRLYGGISLSAGAGGGPKGAKNTTAGTAGAFQGSGAVIGRASEQRETKSGAPKKAGRGSVLDGLRGAFTASFYGARLASRDAAREWISRSFDATPEATTAIVYEEKMRLALDRIDPASIPGFLREQDVSAAGAKRLAASAVSGPAPAAGGKTVGDFSSGLFDGPSGGGSPEDGDDGAGSFSSPEDEPSFRGLDTLGFGGECGCTAAAPCCCLPGNRSGGAGDFPSFGG